MTRAALSLALVAAAACSSQSSKPEPSGRIKFWHTFNPTETEALNEILAERKKSERAHGVETTLLPFARGQTMLRRVLESNKECPDLARIDATWLPGLASAGLLHETPPATAKARDWLPEAAELARFDGVQYGLPQSIDGLALIYRKDTPARAQTQWPPPTVGELIAAAHRFTRDGNHGLGVRVDGYWFAAFLRAWGGDVIDPATGALGVDTPSARDALERFAAFFGPKGIAGTPPPSGNEAQHEAREFRNHAVEIVVNGPWAVTELGNGSTEGLDVAPFPRGPDGKAAAPRGGQILVVPKCARDAGAAWRLAVALTAPAIQADWAQRFGVVPTSRGGLEGAGAFSRRFYEALQVTRPLPRHPVTSEMFDDLNPAIVAVVAGDATAEEALAGVTRAWKRLLKRHHIEPRDYTPPPNETPPNEEPPP